MEPPFCHSNRVLQWQAQETGECKPCTEEHKSHSLVAREKMKVGPASDRKVEPGKGLAFGKVALLKRDEISRCFSSTVEEPSKKKGAGCRRPDDQTVHVRIELDKEMTDKILYALSLSSQSAQNLMRFCLETPIRIDAPFHLRTMFHKFASSLNAGKIHFKDYKITGGVLRRLLLGHERKPGSDIDLLACVVRNDKAKVDTKQLMDTFLDVLAEIFPIDDGQRRTLNIQGNIFTHRFGFKEPYLLKSVFYNKSFMFATIPLVQPSPDDPQVRKKIDLDMRVTTGDSGSSCVCSADSFQVDLLPFFFSKEVYKLQVTGASGYEKVKDHLKLARKGLFTVNQQQAALTENGLRSLVKIMHEGFIPQNYKETLIYFEKWEQEYIVAKAGQNANCLGDDFFNTIGKYIDRHYFDLFSKVHYLLNFRAFIEVQDWKRKNEFLPLFDLKIDRFIREWDARDVVNGTVHDRIPCNPAFIKAVVKSVFFWGRVQKLHGVHCVPLSDGEILFFLKSGQQSNMLMSGIPWLETHQCLTNLAQLESQMSGMRHYLENAKLPASPKQLLSAISEVFNESRKYPTLASVTEANNVKSFEEMQIQTMFVVAFTRPFNYVKFFHAVISLCDYHVQDTASRETAIRTMIEWIRMCHPGPAFENLWNNASDDIPEIFLAIANDLSFLRHRKALIDFLLKPSWIDICQKIFPEIMFGLPLPQLEEYFDMFFDEEVKQNKRFSSRFYPLLEIALSTPAKWEMLYKKKIFSFLAQAEFNEFPYSLMNKISTFLQDKEPKKTIVKHYLKLIELAKSEKLINDFASCLKNHRKNPERMKNIRELLPEITRLKILSPRETWQLFSGISDNLPDRDFLLQLSLSCLRVDQDGMAEAEAHEVIELLAQDFESITKSSPLPIFLSYLRAIVVRSKTDVSPALGKEFGDILTKLKTFSCPLSYYCELFRVFAAATNSPILPGKKVKINTFIDLQELVFKAIAKEEGNETSRNLDIGSVMLLHRSFMRCYTWIYAKGKEPKIPPVPSAHDALLKNMALHMNMLKLVRESLGDGHGGDDKDPSLELLRFVVLNEVSFPVLQAVDFIQSIGHISWRQDGPNTNFFEMVSAFAYREEFTPCKKEHIMISYITEVTHELKDKGRFDMAHAFFIEMLKKHKILTGTIVVSAVSSVLIEFIDLYWAEKKTAHLDKIIQQAEIYFDLYQKNMQVQGNRAILLQFAEQHPPTFQVVDEFRKLVKHCEGSKEYSEFVRKGKELLK